MDPGHGTDALSAADLLVEWRLEADRMATRGFVEPAQVIRSMADQLSAVLGHEGSAILTLRQASAESGYSADHLRRMVSAGDVENAGRRGAPRIRRSDLPRKTGGLTQTARPSTLERSKAAIVRSIANQGN